LLNRKGRFAYNIIDSLNPGKEGGGLKSRKLSMCGDIDKEEDTLKVGLLKITTSALESPTFLYRL
jgi:hypothetical protein